MQTLDSFYETAIRRGHHLVGAPLIVAEWNFNNIYEPDVTNTPDDQNWAYGNKYFPVKSVTNSIRPKSSGIFAAFTQDASTTSNTTLGVAGSRYYTTGSDPEKVFTYWVCPTLSDIYKVGTSETGEEDSSLPEHYGVSRGTILVEYPEYVNSNKVRVLFNLGPTPVDWSIFLHTEGAPGDGYVEVENPTVDPITGKAEIWWDGATWLEDQQLDESVYARIDKVKVEVRAVDVPGKYLQVVEVMAGREIDLTARVLDYSINYQMDDVDFIAPVGRLVAGDGRITFNNTDLKINEQVDSDFAGLLKGRCEYRTYVKYDLSDYEGTEALMRTGTLFANDWQQVNEYEYQVEMWDILKLLQITKLPGRLFENMSLARIISQILDSVGIDSYNLDPDDFDDSSIVKYFWASGDETVFDVIDNLCKSYQAAVFVDEFGVIQLLTRSQIANELDDPVWTFRGEQVGDDIADIQTLQKKYNLQANTVTIKYKEREAKVDATDVTQQPLTSKIWEATDTVVLRAGALTRQLSADGTYDFPTWERDVWIPASVAPTWPFKGKVNVDGELIEYDGKGYATWDYSTDPPTYAEILVHSTEEKLAADKETYASYNPGGTLTNPGGIGSDPSKQNKYTGRLFVTKRDADNGGRQAAHYTYWNYGWMPMHAATYNPVNPAFPGKYVQPAGSTYSQADLKDYINRPNWNRYQTRWSINESVLKCDNTPDGDVNSCVLIRDVGSTDCREIGTRIRLSGTEHAVGGIIFYLSNAVGYDDSTTLTDPLLANRWYQLTITTTEMVDKWGRGSVPNEICLEVKNGNGITRMTSTRALGWGGPAVGSDGTWTIVKDKWYDVDLVIKDPGLPGEDAGGANSTRIEVYIDGQWVDTWKTDDNIRPTAWMGVHSRQKSISEFEYFYASEYKTNAAPSYVNEDNFDAQTFNLVSGTNKSTTLNLVPANANNGYQSVLSFSTTGSQATISSLKIKSGLGSTFVSKQVGPLVVKPNTRVLVDLDTAVNQPVGVDLTYTSSQELSVCWETTAERNFPYDDEGWVTPPAHSFYDLAKGGYLSSKKSYLSMDNPLYPVYTEGSAIINDRFLFTDDFGAVVHEVRDFELDYDVSPAKGVRVYMSNNNVRLVSHTYNPEKGIFTLANASNRDEIVNGTEEIDADNTIDHILMIYGYILEDKGDKTKEVKEEGSIRRYGPISINIDADWIFSEAEAEVLGDWIIEHWSDPMDTVTLDVFSNTFSQIGDKVNIVYPNANILSSWLYIVSERNSTFDGDGLSTSVTLRRVR